MSAFNLLSLRVNNQQVLNQQLSDETREELEILTQNLLFYLSHYFESGYEIFLCFSPKKEKPISGKELYKWFSESDEEVSIRGYFVNTDSHLSKYRKFLNALKHSSNQIAIFQFITPETGSTIGFYLEGVNDDGAISPAIEFHPMYDGRFTAWSYNFHMKNIYFLIYHIAEEMNTVVDKLISSHQITLENTPVPLVSENLEKIARGSLEHARSLSRGRLHFPQEANEVSKIPLLSQDNSALAFVDYLPTEAIIPRGSKAAFYAKGNGFSRSWTLPYFDGTSNA